MMSVQSTPAATCFTFSSAIDATAVGRYRATSSPCPSRPPALQPHDHRAPFTVIATEWKGPEHTLLTGSMATRRGTSLTQGTLPDGPSPNWPCRWGGLVGDARPVRARSTYGWCWWQARSYQIILSKREDGPRFSQHQRVCMADGDRHHALRRR